MRYIEYNREERDLCAHLFRLLLADQPRWRPLKQLFGLEAVNDPRLYSEVALIRDAYHARKPDTSSFVETLCKFLANQHSVYDYTEFSELPEDLRNGYKTHPQQLRKKMSERKLLEKEGDATVYGALQALFNAKPDLAICNSRHLLVVEAKYTLGFDPNQLRRTREIGEIWSQLLYSDLGFDTVPDTKVHTLGLSKYKPDLAWEFVYEIARDLWGDDDFSVKVLSKVS